MNRSLLALASAIALAAAATIACAQDKAVIRIVVPYAAGGQTDIMARLLAPSMAKMLDRTVIVENRPGAAALIATRYVQNAAPDANNLLFHNTGFVALPLTQKDAGYDPIKDFAPVSIIGYGPNFLMVHHSVPAKTVAEFIAYVKTLPNGIESANSGIGSSGHISAMLFAKMAGINIVLVPYKGSAETANALIAGDVKMQITATTSALNAQIQAGKVRILGVAAKHPSSLAPGIPIIADTLPGYAIEGWYGLLATAGSPPAEIAKRSDAIKKALEDPEIRAKFAAVYIDAGHVPPAGFANAIVESTAFWKKVVAELNLPAK